MRALFSAGALLVALSLCSTLPAQWTVPGDFASSQAAIDSPAVLPGALLRVGPGSFDGAVVTKKVLVVGVGRTVIKGGPMHWSGLHQGFRLVAGSDGSAFAFLHFASTAERDIRNNIVSHNVIGGKLHVSPSDGGGYNGTGIVLYSDNRQGRKGAKAITSNGVFFNRINLTLDDPRLGGKPVDVFAFELTDTSMADTVITGNVIAFNDWRKMTNQIALTPMTLDDKNIITRNFGSNRGHGAPPGTFMPGH